VYDAEGFDDGPPCPACGHAPTRRYAYVEGFDEHECPACGWRSDEAAIADLRRAAGDLLEGDAEAAPPPLGRPLRA
jgi:hypothetical protein